MCIDRFLYDILLRPGKRVVNLNVEDIQLLYYNYETFCILYNFLISIDIEFWTDRIMNGENMVYNEWISMILSFGASHLEDYISYSKYGRGNEWLSDWLNRLVDQNFNSTPNF
jgi:hypothetical protein